jgi:hypothetical protein
LFALKQWKLKKIIGGTYGRRRGLMAGASAVSQFYLIKSNSQGLTSILGGG